MQDEIIIKNSFAKSFSDGCRPVRDLTIDQWCDEFGKLPPSSSEPGKFRVDRTPYMREIMQACTPMNGINFVSMMMGAQLSKTETLNQIQAYLMHYNPQSFVVYQPTVEMVESYVKTKINPMIETNEVLSVIFNTKNANNLTEKSFKGCMGSYKGANAGASYRMISVPIVIGDEIDGFPRDVEGEGSPIKLMENRSISFGKKSKLILTSTPTEKELSNIEDAFLAGDQRYYHIPCPHCGALQTLKFYTGLKYTKNPKNESVVLPESVYYECEVCQAHITEDKKTWFLTHGKWIPANPEAPANRRSYQLSSLYSPLGWFSWERACNEWLACQGDNEAKKTFVNTKLGETWYEKSEQPSHAKLKALQEPYERYEVNERAVRLFAGIDTQKDRFAVLVVAFGEDQEQWVVAYEELLGSPGDSESFDNLKLFIDRPFKSRAGVDLFIEGAAIDTGGHFASEVYNFVRKNQNKFYAIKGASTNIGTFLRQGKDIDHDLKTGKKYDNPLKLYLTNTILAKKTIYSFLNSMLVNETEAGPGVIHFSSQLPDNFFTMLVSERLTRKQVNGIIQEKFILAKGARNEALDCYGYTYNLAYAVGKINNLYGENYKAVYEQVIGSKLRALENKDKPKPQPVQKKPSWLNKSKNGFSIK